MKHIRRTSNNTRSFIFYLLNSWNCCLFRELCRFCDNSQLTTTFTWVELIDTVRSAHEYSIKDQTRWRSSADITLIWEILQVNVLIISLFLFYNLNLLHFHSLITVAVVGKRFLCAERIYGKCSLKKWIRQTNRT